MANGCCIEGHTEKETLELTLRWMSGWSKRLAKDLMSVRMALDCIETGSGLRGDRGDATKEDFAASIAATKALLHGLAHGIGESYSDDGEDVLPGLLRGFGKVVEQCDARKPFRTTCIRGEDMEQAKACLGSACCDQYVVVRIDGNVDFMRLRYYSKELGGYLSRCAAERLGDGKETRKVAFVFESHETLRFLMDMCGEVMSELSGKYGNARFLCPSDEFVEMELPPKTESDDEKGMVMNVKGGK